MNIAWGAVRAGVLFLRPQGLSVVCGVLCGSFTLSDSATAQFAQVVTFSRATTGTASSSAGSNSVGPLPLSSSSTTWAPLAYTELLVPADTTIDDAVCAPDGVISNGSARVDQFVGITGPDSFQIASTVYGIANVSVDSCSSLSGSANGATSGSWTVVFNALSPTTLTLSRANAAVTGGNAAGASASMTYTINGPGGLVTTETRAVNAPAGADIEQGQDEFSLAPGQYTLQVNSSAFMAATGTSGSTVGGAAYAAFNLTFSFGPGCDGIDFNNDGLFPDTLDIDDFISVFQGGPCSNDPNCGDIDFNNDGLFPDTLDIDALLSVFSGGPCLT